MLVGNDKRVVPFSSSGSNFHKYVLHEDLGYVAKYIIYIIVMAISLGTSEWREEGSINHALKKIENNSKPDNFDEWMWFHAVS